MTINEMLALASGTFSKEGSSANGYYVNFYFKDAEGDTRRETLFDGLTNKEASDVVKKLTEAKRIVNSVCEMYEDFLYT